jgi:hypothetical protein
VSVLFDEFSMTCGSGISGAGEELCSDCGGVSECVSECESEEE